MEEHSEGLLEIDRRGSLYKTIFRKNFACRKKNVRNASVKSDSNSKRGVL